MPPQQGCNRNIPTAFLYRFVQECHVNIEDKNCCCYAGTMRLVFWIIVVFCALIAPARAENARPIIIHDVSIPLPVPAGYIDVSTERELPPNNAMFLTKVTEPWEEYSEFSEGIFFYGLGFAPSTDAIKQQKFEDIVRLFRLRIDAQIEGKDFVMPESPISLGLINSIYQKSYGNNARTLEVTDNRADRKALLIDTGFVMPGVTTYPIMEEISFSRLFDRIIIFHSVRVDTGLYSKEPKASNEIRAELKDTGAEIRDGLVPGR